MNLRFVEAFYGVATLKSVTRAAEKLSLTQSAMSSRIGRHLQRRDGRRAQRSRLPLCITHAPGKMFVTDLEG